MIRNALLALLALTACNNTAPDTGSAAGDDTATGDDTGDDIETITFTFQLLEFLSGDPVAGVALTVGDDTYTSDDDGIAEMALPSESYVQIDATHDGFPAAHYYRYVGSVDWGTDRYYPSDATLELMAGMLGLTPDTSKGQVLGITPLVCDPTDATSCYFLEGLAITLDLGYQVALAEDSSQATGFSVTNESMGGSVLFVNVDPGTVNATLTPPSGYSCDYMPPEVEVVASHYHEVTVFCSED